MGAGPPYLFEFDSVEQDLILTTKVFSSESQRVLLDNHLQINAIDQTAQRRLQKTVTCRRSCGVERPDRRRRVHDQRRHCRAGDQRFVQVHDIERFVAQDLKCPQSGGQVGGDWGYRPIGRERKRIAEWSDKTLWGWPVARPEYTGYVTPPT